MFEKLFTTLFPNVKIKILNYQVFNRQSFDENFKSVPDTPAIFVEMECVDCKKMSEYNDISEHFTKFTGFELVIDFT